VLRACSPHGVYDVSRKLGLEPDYLFAVDHVRRIAHRVFDKWIDAMHAQESVAHVSLGQLVLERTPDQVECAVNTQLAIGSRSETLHDALERLNTYTFVQQSAQNLTQLGKRQRFRYCASNQRRGSLSEAVEQSLDVIQSDQVARPPSEQRGQLSLDQLRNDPEIPRSPA
jgi:hypothetical protein